MKFRPSETGEKEFIASRGILWITASELSQQARVASKWIPSLHGSIFPIRLILAGHQHKA